VPGKKQVLPVFFEILFYFVAGVCQTQTTAPPLFSDNQNRFFTKVLLILYFQDKKFAHYVS